MKLFMIAKSNIKKNRSISVTLVLLIIFATILLYIGTNVILDINTFIDKKNEELNGSDFTAFAATEYNDSIQKILNGMDNIKELETEDAIYKEAINFKNITLNDKTQSIGCMILNADKKETISRLNIINKADKVPKDAIILPYFLKISKGYKAGDTVTITSGKNKYSFTIYGFAEDVMFATPTNISIFKCYVFQDEFNKLYKNTNEKSQAVLVKAKLEKGTNTTDFESSFIKNINKEMMVSTNSIHTIEYATMKVGVGVFMFIIMTILIVFSLIIVVIALTVIRFAIVTHIESNIKNIGSMEAMGYTGGQLTWATVIQFVVITAVSNIIGFIIAFSASRVVKNVVSSAIGLSWDGGINVLAIIISFTIIMGLVIIIAYMAAVKIKKITPIIAMRSGVDTHNFKKNHFPLSKSNMNVNAVLGLKTLMQNMKQNIAVIIIVILMSFVTVLAFTINYNFNVDNTAFIRLIGLEKSQFAIGYTGKDSIKIFDEINQMKQMKKTVRYSDLPMELTFGDRESTPNVDICNDYDKLEIKTIIKGRYPIHNNEIAVTSVVLKQLKANIGDVINVKGINKKQDFVIVGETQQISYLGKCAFITEDGMNRINPDFTPTCLYVYLHDKNKIKNVIKEIEDKYSNLELSITNIDDSFDIMLASFNTAIKVLCAACIAITIFIISLILYLLIKIRLLKERMHIGVAKALGYTTKQLILQVVVSFCPVCIVGTLIGTVLAMYLTNPAFAASLSVSGIVNSSLIINPMLILVTFLAISLFSILVTTLVSLRIRKITPCELFR